MENLEFISKSPNREIYLEAAKGNPRILEWLNRYAAEEEKYNLTELKIRVQGQSTKYIAEYLFEIMTETQGEDFENFLRKGAVFRQPGLAQAFELFGTSAQLKRAAWLTLVEQENKKDGTELCRVHPMIRDAEWGKLPKNEQKTAHEKASDWYDAEIRKLESRPYEWLTEIVYHALQAVQEKDGSVSGLLNDLGQAYQVMGDYLNVIQWTEKALEIDKGIFGEEDSRVAIRYNNLGTAYDSLGEYDKAIEYIEQSLFILNHFFNSEHPYVKKAKDNLNTARTMNQDGQDAKG